MLPSPLLPCLQWGLAEKGNEVLRFFPTVPQESSEVVSRRGWLSPTDLCFTTSPFGCPRFPSASIAPPAHPIREERANPVFGGRLWAVPLLTSPWLGFHIPLRAQGGLLGQEHVLK